MPDLSQKAILTALSQDWEQAITLNEQIIKENNQDLEAVSRLAYAYLKTGNIEQAKKLYRKILAVDKYNYIAKKNLDRISSIPKSAKSISTTAKRQIPLQTFIEEPGKTKTVTLINTAPDAILANIGVGDAAVLVPKKYSIDVRNENKVYLGAIPDDISFRLLRLLKAGNTYSACVKNIQKHTIAVFIREVSRGKRFGNLPSFQANHENTTVKIPKSKKKIVAAEQKKIPAAKSQSDDFDE